MLYTTFVSDGDSSAYRAVCALNNGKGPYGEKRKVQKAECINHVAKRLGTGLSGLKKPGKAKVEGKALAVGEKPKSHTKMSVYFRLEDPQLQQVKAVYERLTTDDMMSRCLQGLTQNRNEHLHSRIWKVSPKHRCASKRMVDFATATAVCTYNVGYIGSNFTDLLGIEYTVSMDKYLKAKDASMDTPFRRKSRNKKKL
ncbi:hypothetical protein Pcinc_008803 [Petrolisthes cinctipes]|uniref:Mutator-like transposase domain-containing protein n=1 Tax=Petrolisthes cinctipes TaxID=88211 RepID=A0AAE1G5T0_PETCI|nr:hypothetical protein Pcinc_008803 [Petrolisthes cinctipes]